MLAPARAHGDRRLARFGAAGSCYQAHRLMLPHEEQVLAVLVERAPKALCDECVGDHTRLKRQQVSAALRRLRDRQLKRHRDRCSGCCTTRRVSVVHTF